MTTYRTPDLASAVKLAPTHSLDGIMARIAADPSRAPDAPTLEVPALEVAAEALPVGPSPVAAEPRPRPSLAELLPGRGALAGIGVAVWLSILLLLLALGGGLGVRSATRLLLATLLVPAVAAAALGWLLYRQRGERQRLADQLARTRTLLDSARGLTGQDSEVAIYETLPVHVRALVAADEIGVAVFQRGRFVGRYDASGLIDGLNDAATPLEEQVVVHGRAVTLAPVAGDDAAGAHRLALPVRSGETVVAVLVVSRRQPFGEDESAQLATLCEHVGIALAKARLFGLVSTGKREWEGIFDALGEGLALIAPDGGVRRANIALASLAAVPPQKAVERHHHELLPFLDAGAEECAVCRTLRTGARSEHTVQRPGGVLFRLAVTPHPTGGAVLVATDLTLERRAFEAVRDAERRLAEAERLARIGRLTAGLSSEMSDPLMGILGMTSLLLDQTHDAEAVEMLEAIRREARRAAAVTSELAKAS
jgi:PAS domain-containing protein